MMAPDDSDSCSDKNMINGICDDVVQAFFSNKDDGSDVSEGF